MSEEKRIGWRDVPLMLEHGLIMENTQTLIKIHVTDPRTPEIPWVSHEKCLEENHNHRSFPVILEAFKDVESGEKFIPAKIDFSSSWKIWSE